MQNDFQTHELQKIMALFLLNPVLYKDHAENRDKQGYFFYQFRIFANNYYQFTNTEANIYFDSVRKDKPGESNICGGGGKRSHSSKHYMKSRYRESETKRSDSIDALSRKYRLNLEEGFDERLFLGTREIWNKLDDATNIVSRSEFADVASRSYCDETFATPIPVCLDKTLVPLAIRNRAVQKHSNIGRRPPIVFRTTEEEDDFVGPIKVTASAAKEEEAPPISNIVFVRPSELDEW